MNLSEYESDRGFDEGTFEEYGIYAKGDTILIPTLGRHGTWYERTHRPYGQPKYLTPKGEKAHLYNPKGLGPHTEDDIWIAEGEFDTLSLIVVGVAAFGILGTEGFRPTWAKLFHGGIKRPDPADPGIVLALDPDHAGIKKANQMAALWPDGLTSRFDPSPYDDLNHWFREDREGFRETVLAW